jgi:hypothetical protein
VNIKSIEGWILELLPCWGILVNDSDIGGAVLEAINSIGEDQGGNEMTAQMGKDESRS